MKEPTFQLLFPSIHPDVHVCLSKSKDSIYSDITWSIFRFFDWTEIFTAKDTAMSYHYYHRKIGKLLHAIMINKIFMDLCDYQSLTHLTKHFERTNMLNSEQILLSDGRGNVARHAHLHTYNSIAVRICMRVARDLLPGNLDDLRVYVAPFRRPYQPHCSKN